MTEEYDRIEKATGEGEGSGHNPSGGENDHIKPKLDWGVPMYPPTWDWDKKVLIEGYVVSKEMINIQGRDVQFMNIKTIDKIYTVWYGIVLEDRINKMDVTKGDYIGIRFLGMVVGAGGFEYRDFDVRLIKQTTIGVDEKHE